MRSFASGCRRAVLASVLAPVLMLGGVGCGIYEPASLDDVLNPLAYRPTEQYFESEAKLERDMAEIDEFYGEERSPARVALSLDIAEKTLSPRNDYEAAWRGARAAAWLALNHPESEERLKFARKGVGLGNFAMAQPGLSVRVEPYYYTAISLAAYVAAQHDLGRVPKSEHLRAASHNARLAVELDPAFDHAGPHRFLGQLITKTSDTFSSYSMGDFEEGLEHLKRAVALAPDFGLNRLNLARAYIEEGEPDLARGELEALTRLGSPTDYTVEHRKWLLEGAELLAYSAEDTSGEAVDVTRFQPIRGNEGK